MNHKSTTSKQQKTSIDQNEQGLYAKNYKPAVNEKPDFKNWHTE